MLRIAADIKKEARSFGLDIARALAISLVLVTHFSKANENFDFLGVEIFFSLSGFLIVNILWRNLGLQSRLSMNSVFNFWCRRWYRTLPNYYLFFL